jgi:hypothetical protein
MDDKFTEDEIAVLSSLNSGFSHLPDADKRKEAIDSLMNREIVAKIQITEGTYLYRIIQSPNSCAFVEFTSAGPILHVYGVPTRSYLGTWFNAESLDLAAKININAKRCK